MSIKNRVKLFTQNFVGIGEVRDDELMELIAQENHMAFEILYKRHKVGLYNFLLHSSKGDRELAAEVMQESFLRLYQRANQFKKGSKVTSWLFKIGRNLLIDLSRKKDALNFKDELKGHDDELKIVENMVFEMTDAETLIIQKVEKQQINHCLSKLHERQREAVTLRMFSELSYDDISDVMSTTSASVKSLLNRAKKGLFSCLKEFFSER